jgi:type II secretory pathway component PulF
MTAQKIVINPKRINISGEDKLSFLSNLGTMLQAGISIVEAVDSLAEDATGNMKLLLIQLKADLEQGKQVNESLGQFTKIFNKVNINIIKASEESGTLEKVLKDMKETMMREMEFQDKVKGAMAYPFFVMIVFTLVLVGMLFGIVPKIGTVFKSLNMPLPLPTRVLIYMSDMLVNNTFKIVIGVITWNGFLYWLFKAKREFVLNILFKLPGVSGMVQDIDLTKFTRSMALLMSSGIPITSALELTLDVVIKPQVRLAISDAYQVVMQGGRFSQGLSKRGKLFPGVLRKMIEVGEKTGSLDKSLQEASEFLDYQTSKKIKTMTTLMEPMMLVGVAVLVGGMMLSIVAPIYGLIGSIGAKR